MLVVSKLDYYTSAVYKVFSRMYSFDPHNDKEKIMYNHPMTINCFKTIRLITI